MEDTQRLCQNLMQAETSRAKVRVEVNRLEREYSNAATRLGAARDRLQSHNAAVDDALTAMREHLVAQASGPSAEAGGAASAEVPMAQPMEGTSFPQPAADREERPGRRRRGGAAESGIDIST